MPQRFEFRSSRYLALWLIAMTCLAATAVVPLGWPLWSRALLLAILAFNLRYCLRHYAWLRTSGACRALVVSQAGARLLLRDGRDLPCAITSDSLVTSYLVVLNVAVEGLRGGRTIVILPDSMDPSAFRQLRVWLKWGVSAAGVARGREHGGRR